MRIVGGKELPDASGKLAAYVSKVVPGGLVDHIGGINEGNWDNVYFVSIITSSSSEKNVLVFNKRAGFIFAAHPNDKLFMPVHNLPSFLLAQEIQRAWVLI